MPMGLLDELEQQAERRRAEEAELAAVAQAREQVWLDRLEPALRELETYLKQLTDQLAFLKKRTRVVYPLPPYGDIVAYVEPSYTLRGRAPAKNSYEILLEFSASVASEECPLIENETGARLKGLIGVLQPLRLNGMTDVRKNANGEIIAARIRAKGRIPLSLLVSADLESGVAKMVFNNLEGFGQSSRSFRPEQLDSTLYDALGRFIAREERHFAQEAVSDDIRRQLQTRIQHDQMKRQWETKLARQLAEDESKVLASLDPSVRPGSMLGRLRLLSRRLFGR